jgi:hypothetical protein
MAIRTLFTELFQVATPEALSPNWAKDRLVAHGGDQTSRTQVFDVARGLDWPRPYTGRALRNAFVDSWDGREAEPTANLVTRIMAQAEGLLRGAPRQLGH